MRKPAASSQVLRSRAEPFAATLAAILKSARWRYILGGTLNVSISSNCQRSQLVETLHPFRELSFVDTPLATDFKGGQLLSLDHLTHGSPGQLQEASRLLEGQKAKRLIMTFHRCFHGTQLEQRQCQYPAE